MSVDAEIQALEEQARALRAQRAREKRRVKEKVSPERRSEAARKAAQARWGRMTPEQREEALRPSREALQARQDRRARLRAAGLTDAEVDRWIKDVVDGAPPLTAAQREKLADLLPAAGA